MENESLLPLFFVWTFIFWQFCWGFRPTYTSSYVVATKPFINPFLRVVLMEQTNAKKEGHVNKLTCSYLKLFVGTNKKKQQCVDVRSWLDPCKSYQTRLGDDSESEGRPALVRAAQLSSPLLHSGKTLQCNFVLLLCNFLSKSALRYYTKSAVQNFVVCTTKV